MHFSLVTGRKIVNASIQAVDDVILPLYYAINKLGYDVEIRYGSTNKNSVNIVFGAHRQEIVKHYDLPANSIVFNLEQFAPKSRWFTEPYIKLLKNYAVWDYSQRNCIALKDNFSIKSTHVRLGFVDEMARIPQNAQPHTDVLFYGAINDRRAEILAQMRHAGINLHIATSAYGAQRDFLLFGSKLVLNIHYYHPAILELPRLGYLFANHKAVVSERAEDTEVYPEHEDICFFYPKEELVQKTAELLRNEKARSAKARAAYKIFSGIRQEDILAKIIGKRTRAVGVKKPLPTCMNVGSGKNFLAHALNIDVVEHCNPDILYDLAVSPLKEPVTIPTERFGEITLQEGSFSQILAHDVLEHVPDLPTMMGNMLYLLEEGGELEVSVPYDLSLGAWQDPTHLRAFNGNSWKYYCQWAWYLGWREYRFDMISIEYIPGDYGKNLMEMHESGIEKLLHVPRAVEAMAVVLKKRKSTVLEKIEFDFMFTLQKGKLVK